QTVVLTSGSSGTANLVTQGFNSTSVPAGWASNDPGSYLSYVSSSSSPTVSGPAEGSDFVSFNSYSASAGTTAQLYQTTSFSTTAYNTVTVNFSWFQDNGYSSDADGVTVQYSTDGVTWNSVNTYARYNAANPGWTSQTCALPAGANGQATLYIAFLFTSQYGNNCNLDNVVVTGTSTSVTSTYTDFNNMILAAPSPGSVLGTTNVCPGSYNFTSSLSGSPGILYSWTVNTVSGNTPTITSATAASTNITFPNTTTGNLVFTVTCTITSECCGALTPVTYSVTIFPYPVAPTAAAATTPICAGASDVLTATAPAGASFNWYTVSSGGSTLGTSSTYTLNPVALGSQTYYVDATSAQGCVSTTRTPVTVVGTATAAPAVVNSTACGSGNQTVSISAPVAGYTYSWYSGSCGGTLLQSGLYTNFTYSVSATTTFYVSATAPGGCNASTCTSVTMTVTGPPNPITWTGSGTTGANNWFDPNNWGGCLPTCGDNVHIPFILSGNYPNIGANATPAACKTVTLDILTSLTFSSTKAELDVCGDFIHNGTLSTGNLGMVVFMGTVAQNYTRTTGSGNFNNVMINNTTGGASSSLTFTNSDMTLGTSGSFTFTSGYVITGANNLVITNTSSNAMGGYATNMYVYGNLKRSILSTGSYDLPVGEAYAGKNYQLANINFTTATSIGVLTARFDLWGVGGYNNVAEGGFDLACSGDYTSCVDLDNGYWSINADVNPLTGNYTTTLNSNNYTNSGCGVYWTVTKYPSGGTGWILDGSCVTPCTSCPSIVSRTGMNGFSKFAVAQSITVLPVELISFTGRNMTHVNYLRWTTATETNCNFFSIERQLPNGTFSEIGKVNGSGTTSTVHNYTFQDDPAPSGLSYYRLRQVDLNGAFTYSNVVVLNDETDAAILENLYPNPTTQDMNFDFVTRVKGNLTIEVTDVLGRAVVSDLKPVAEGRNTLQVHMSELAPGPYYLKVSFDGTGFKSVHKVVKQ
ncbi:MAG TPA: T9SS type A sorting domain-containing protein, partial [Bacteroidia bacterium]|nr:T9SS type A sorting domain-containing protein [Bacteroidia bacterium]